MRTYIFLLALIILSSCKKERFNKIEPVVERGLIKFDNTEIPSRLQDILNSKQILVFGETHYVQEHQEYVSNIIEYLSIDSIAFLTESSNAFNWMTEDYINGESDFLPDHVRYFDNLWIEKIKEINNQKGLLVQMYAMDVNHNKDNFNNSIAEIEKVNGPIIEFQNIKSLTIDSDEYLLELDSLQIQFENDADSLIQKFGDLWYNRYKKLIELEKKSSNYRSSKNESFREEFMVDFILSIIERNPTKKIIINCGMYHAQKQTLMGSDINRIGFYIYQNFPDETYTISFVGIKGERKSHFYDANVISFNLLNETKKHDLIKIIGDKAGNHLSFLSLEDEVFEKDMLVTYTTASTITLSPSKQFNALITYPEISLLKSMNEFDYE